MAVLKYKSNGTIKTLGITQSGASSVTSVNGKTGAVTGLYDADNPPPYPVSSVNGKTGAVTGLYDADNPPPYPVSSVNGKTGAVTGLYGADSPPPYPVSSVNGKTGAVTGLYDADNPPPYPVSSVNGKTGAVTGLYDANNQPPYPVTSVNGNTGNVTTHAYYTHKYGEQENIKIGAHSMITILILSIANFSVPENSSNYINLISWNVDYIVGISAALRSYNLGTCGVSLISTYDGATLLCNNQNSYAVEPTGVYLTLLNASDGEVELILK